MNTFSSGLYTFKNFTSLTRAESEEVLLGRNDPDVRRWMTSDTPIAAHDHHRFMSALKTNSTALYIRIERAGHFVGVYSLNDLVKGSGAGGFWVTAYARERLLPLNVVFQGMSHMFRDHNVNHIYGFQKQSNQSAIRLNALLGLHVCANEPLDTDGMQKIETTKQQWENKTMCDVALLKLMDRMEKLNGTN